jgi:rhomboid protease GluP
MFMHGDIIHLLSNIIGLVLFGTFIENIVSKTAYLIIYFISGVLGNIMTLFLLPPYIISLGASGAIYGLIGASVIYIIFERNTTQLLITFVYLLYFIVTSFSPEINYAAHIFGLISGLAIGYFFIRKSVSNQYSEY